MRIIITIVIIIGGAYTLRKACIAADNYLNNQQHEEVEAWQNLMR